MNTHISLIFRAILNWLDVMYAPRLVLPMPMLEYGPGLQVGKNPYGF